MVAFTRPHRGGLVVPSMDERFSTGPLHLGCGVANCSGRSPKQFAGGAQARGQKQSGGAPTARSRETLRLLRDRPPYCSSKRKRCSRAFSGVVFTAKARAAGEHVWPPEARAGAAFGSHDVCPWRDAPRERRG